MYRFYMTIGDWRGIGHGLSYKYLIQSNYPIDRVREAHYQIPATTGIDIGRICCGLNENVVSRDIMEKLAKIGFEIQDDAGFCDGSISLDEMMRLWLFLLMKADPELQLAICEEPQYPRFHFAGRDKKGRHIESVGYGLFLC